jgi:hypothetical protein
VPYADPQQQRDHDRQKQKRRRERNRALGLTGSGRPPPTRPGSLASMRAATVACPPACPCYDGAWGNAEYAPRVHRTVVL